MDNVKFVIIEETEYAIIDHGNEQFTSMPKSVYEAQQVEHLTEKLTGGN